MAGEMGEDLLRVGVIAAELRTAVRVRVDVDTVDALGQLVLEEAASDENAG
jgi:hypothetical protein